MVRLAEQEHRDVRRHAHAPVLELVDELLRGVLGRHDDGGEPLVDDLGRRRGDVVQLDEPDGQAVRLHRRAVGVDAVERGLVGTARTDVPDALVAELDEPLDLARRRRDVVGADVGQASAVAAALADEDEGVVRVQQVLELAAVLVLAEQQAAVGDPEALPAVAREAAAPVDDARAREQQDVDAELLGRVLDPDEERPVEVATGTRERRLVGEDAEDLVAPARETLRDGVRRVARDPDRVEHALARLLADPHPRGRGVVQHERDRRLADARHGGDVGLGDAVPRHGSSSITSSMTWKESRQAGPGRSTG
ncbi:Uncharacterised protein [Mycobacteroides abscessus]|nr:Uncharacterised protein [Mycobacteroides abscessus]